MTTWFNEVPRTEREDGTYQYRLPPEVDPRKHFEDALIAAMFISGDFYMDTRVEAAFRSGLFATERDLSLRIDFPDVLDYQSMIFNQQYQDALATYMRNTQNNMEAIATRISTKLSNDILLAIQRGEDPEAIEEIIASAMASFEAQMTRETIIAINQGNGEGRMIGAVIAAGIVGATALVEHRSALLPTTRPHHAARHRKIYTVQQQRNWWATGANRINCYCSVRPILKK